MPQSDSTVFRRGQLYDFYLNSGERVKGFVVEENRDWVTVESRPEMVRTWIRKSTIARVDHLLPHRDTDEDVFGENRFGGTYLAASSALPFERGQVSATAHWFLLDQSQYAFNEHWAFYASSLTFYPLGLGVRCTYDVGEFDYIGGNVAGFGLFPYSDSESDFLGCFAQLKWTHGTTNRNFTLGAGLIGVNPELTPRAYVNKLLVGIPVLSAGFCNRFAPSWSLVLEGHVLPDEGLMVGAAGFRLLRDRTAWTFGCYGLLPQPYHQTLNVLGGKVVPVPYVSYACIFD